MAIPIHIIAFDAAFLFSKIVPIYDCEKTLNPKP